MNGKHLIWAFIGGLLMASCAHRPERSYPIPTQQQLEWQQLEN